MYNSITGTVTQLHEAECCIDVGGIEYAVAVSAGALEVLRPGTKQRVLVYLHHKEDVLKLYGFADETERSIFLKLLKVSGVGPSLAIKILSGLPVKRLTKSIEEGDIAVLSSVPGLGKKTAQKIILSLQGTLVSADAGGAGLYGDIVSALVDMGFDRNSAAEAVRNSARELPDDITPAEKEERILRNAILLLSRSGRG